MKSSNNSYYDRFCPIKFNTETKISLHKLQASPTTELSIMIKLITLSYIMLKEQSYVASDKNIEN